VSHIILKIVYYVTDHGLGHATRTVAIIRELKKRCVDVVIRSNDPFHFFKKSLPDVKIIYGSTDFIPVMQKNNSMRFADVKTKKKLLKWITNLPLTLTIESQLLKKIQPDLIITDTAFMPILAAKQNQIKCFLISNFVWNEALNLPQYLKSYLYSSYDQSDLILKLPFGTDMDFKNKHDVGLVARYPTISKTQIRKMLGIKKQEKLVLISLSGILKTSIKFPENIHVLDISDYSVIKNSKIDVFVDGQNLVNAADLVICKCGFGFITECLTSGTKFCYVVDQKHKEANGIHRELLKYELNNRINLKTLPVNFYSYSSLNFTIKKLPFSNKKIIDLIMLFYEKVI